MINRFPRVATVMYYRQVGQEQWTEWGNVTQGETSVFRTLQNVIPGAYEVLLCNQDSCIGRWD